MKNPPITTSAIAWTVILFGLLLALPAAAAELDPGIQLLNGRHLEEAREFFTGYATSHPRNAEAAFYLGRVNFEQRRFPAAVIAFERAAVLDPKRSEFQDWLGRSYGNQVKGASFLSQPGLAGKSRDAFARAIALNPDDLQSREDLITYYLNAPFFLGGSVDKALEQAEQIKKRNPARGFEASAAIHAGREEYDRADVDLKAAIQLDAKSERPRVTMGTNYQTRARYAEAFGAFEGALKINPENLDALYQLGKTGALSGQRLDRSQECLEAYLRHQTGPDSPSPANAHYRLGMVLEKKGLRDQARQHYRLALELDPDLKEAGKALARLPR